MEGHESKVICISYVSSNKIRSGATNDFKNEELWIWESLLTLDTFNILLFTFLINALKYGEYN